MWVWPSEGQTHQSHLLPQYHTVSGLIQLNNLWLLTNNYIIPATYLMEGKALVGGSLDEFGE